MTSTRNPLHDFILTPQQQSLLFAALNSNKAANSPANAALNLSPSSFTESPAQGTESLNGLQESPFLDYDYDFGGADSSFDFSFDNGGNAKMIGDLPGEGGSDKADSPDSNDSPDKRSHPDDEEDEDDSTSGGGKRRESEEKVAKKPGRKPLTTEPSSKRKAQNRAAQRAFRERKEKHLKDLENKVLELEKSSEATSHENKLLRAKVEKMTVELNEYKKRITQQPNGRAAAQKPTFGQSFLNNINDVNFQFEFPKFGALPGPPIGNGVKKSPPRQDSTGQISPLEKAKDGLSPSNSSSYSQVGLDSQAKEDLANFSAGLFNSPLINSNVTNASRTSLDSHFSASGATATSSPSASSNSNMGASSSCGTSPEPFTQSPMGFKPVDTLTTIGEEQPNMSGTTQGTDFGRFGNIDVNDFNWLPQNNFQFDPQLFGDYREPQENVLSTGFDDSFFNDAFDVDFTTPYNMPTGGPKKDLIAEIDAAKNSDEIGSNGQLLTCNKIWERLQNCPKVQNGDFDLDGLCSDLQKKAKCSGSGAVVDEKDFKTVMQKYLGKTEQEMAECDLMMESANKTA